MESRIELFTKTLSKNLPDLTRSLRYQVFPDPVLLDEAVKIFCDEHHIADNSNPDSHILERISLLIPLCEKPIDTAYIIKLLEYVDEQCSFDFAHIKYKNISLLSGYINIWNICLTNNWEQVVQTLNGMSFLSSMDNAVTNYALNFPESKALPVLLKAGGFRYGTPLQTILCRGKGRIRNSDPDSNEIFERLEILFDILKKIAAYDVKYILECVATDHAFKDDQDLICILEDIAKVIDAKMAKYDDHSGTKVYKDKIAEIIQYAKDLLKDEAKKVFFAKSRELLFHSESTFAELPKDVKGEIAGLVAKLSL